MSNRIPIGVHGSEIAEVGYLASMYGGYEKNCQELDADPCVEKIDRGIYLKLGIEIPIEQTKASILQDLASSFAPPTYSRFSKGALLEDGLQEIKEAAKIHTPNPRVETIPLEESLSWLLRCLPPIYQEDSTHRLTLEVFYRRLVQGQSTSLEISFDVWAESLHGGRCPFSGSPATRRQEDVIGVATIKVQANAQGLILKRNIEWAEAI